MHVWGISHQLAQNNVLYSETHFYCTLLLFLYSFVKKKKIRKVFFRHPVKCAAAISKALKWLYQNGPRFWNYHNSEPFQMTPSLMVLEFRSFCHIGVFDVCENCLLSAGTKHVLWNFCCHWLRSGEILIQERPYFFGKATNGHWGFICRTHA